MDSVSRAFYEARFELAYLKKKGNEFQDFFSDIMEKRYKNGDFIRVRPWGNVGDKKNDGYLTSQRTLFQVYAPNEMSATDAIKKIDEDFNGALPHWDKHFNKWRFVHNSVSGLGPDVTGKLLDLQKVHNYLIISPFNYEDLRTIFFELPETDITVIIGHAPTTQILNRVSFEDFKAILGHLVINRNNPQPDLRPVPSNKLKINAFGELVEALIKIGLTKTDSVRDFFDRWPNPTFGDSITKEITKEYLRLRSMYSSSDEIFYSLKEFVLDTVKVTPELEMASIVILAYFFEECDIFEREV